MGGGVTPILFNSIGVYYSAIYVITKFNYGIEYNIHVQYINTLRLPHNYVTLFWNFVDWKGFLAQLAVMSDMMRSLTVAVVTE